MSVSQLSISWFTYTLLHVDYRNIYEVFRRLTSFERGGGENSGAQAVLSTPALINSDGLGSRLNCTIIRRRRNRGW